MSLMRGKFYVWQDRERTYISHGRDALDETDDMFPGELFPVDPPELRTGVTEPEMVWLPTEVFNALAYRAVEQMTDEEREDASRDTRWERDRGRR